MPAYGTDEFRGHLLEAGVDRKLVDRIETKLMELNERIQIGRASCRERV